jgi:hypothetical protein
VQNLEGAGITMVQVILDFVVTGTSLNEVVNNIESFLGSNNLINSQVIFYRYLFHH